jgi:DNA-binding transcriptional regulator WhiA
MEGGGNGQTAPAEPAQPAQPAQPVQAPSPAVPRQTVANMKPAEQKKLRAAEEAILKMLAEIGDLTMQMEQARQRQIQLSSEVQRKRQDFQALMRGTVIAHGFDPDAERFNLEIDTGQIQRLG